MNKHPILIADIGGTNARFALADDSPKQFREPQTLQAADFDRLTDAIDAYLNSHNISQLHIISLAVAGPILDEKVIFPNSHWQVDLLELRTRYDTQQAYLLNDWESIAYSLASLNETDLTDIGGQWTTPYTRHYTLGALGPGSGLGTSGVVYQDGQLTPLVAEGGHVGFAPETSEQVEVLNYLHQKFNDRVSRERLLSGPGLVNIYEALCANNKQNTLELSAADIANAAVQQSDPICQHSLNLFFEILGQVAGDTALALGSYQGIFIGGGICQRYPLLLANSNFRKGFENKGRHRHLMQTIPTRLITHSNPGLLGASVFAKSKC